MFVRRRVIFDPSTALAVVLSWGGPERFWETYNGSTKTSQKGLWCTVVKTRMVKWLQLWKRTVWKPPSISIQTQLCYWHRNRGSKHINIVYNLLIYSCIKRKEKSVYFYVKEMEISVCNIYCNISLKISVLMYSAKLCFVQFLCWNGFSSINAERCSKLWYGKDQRHK